MKMFKGSMGEQKLALDGLKSGEAAIGFPEEVLALKSRGKSVKRQSSVFKLNPKLDEVKARVGRRLNKSAMPEETQHPAILPKNHHVSRLLLEHIHW